MSAINGVTFLLLKLSLATDPIEAKTIGWKHETNDVRVLFDNYGAALPADNTFAILNVLQGSITLERVNLALKAREAQQAIQDARLAGKELNHNDVPTGVLFVRTNRTIAIRYRLTDSKIRRMQLKFEADSDFDQVLGILHDLGLDPVQHSNDSRGRSATPATRPEARPTSVRDFHDAARVSTPTFAREDSGNRLIYSSHFPERPQTSDYSSYAQRPSSNAYSPQVNDWRRPPTPLFPIQEDRAFHDDPVMQNIGGFDANSLSQRRRTAAPRPGTALLAGSYTPARPLSSEALSRPADASRLTIAELDANLSFLPGPPPRRELPFGRPGSKRSTASREGERPTSSADLPPLPKPSFINPPMIEKGGLPSRAPLETSSPTIDADDNRPASKPATAKTKAAAKKPATLAAAKKKVPASKSTDRPLTALSTTSTNIKVSDSTPLTSDSVLGPSHTNQGDLRSALSRIDAAMPKFNHAASGRTPEQDTLANYAEMDYDDRMVVLEKLIVDGVEDENFARLCEDVQGCWQRIGFGR